MDEIQEMLSRAMPEIARRIENELVLVCPVDKGRLKGSIKVKAIDGGILIWMVWYGKIVEFGSPPHVIRPKDKKALKFKSGGDVIFAKEVRHPGSRPNPFIRNTLQIKLPKIIIEEMAR